LARFLPLWSREGKNGLTASELRQGDKIHFDFVEKNGKMWVIELRRTKKADRD
jgi:hypothetical protein